MNILIKNVGYQVFFVDGDNVNLRGSTDGFEILGRTDCFRKIIYIRQDLDPQTMLNVIIHELTHAFVNVYGFADMTFNQEQICVFNEIYASDIVSLANEIFRKEMNKNEN